MGSSPSARNHVLRLCVPDVAIEGSLPPRLSGEHAKEQQRRNLGRHGTACQVRFRGGEWSDPLHQRLGGRRRRLLAALKKKEKKILKKWGGNRKKKKKKKKK